MKQGFDPISMLAGGPSGLAMLPHPFGDAGPSMASSHGDNIPVGATGAFVLGDGASVGGSPLGIGGSGPPSWLWLVFAGVGVIWAVHRL